MERLTKEQALNYLRIPKVFDKLDKATQNAITNNTASLKPVVLYVRKKIVFGSGTVRLVDSNTRKTRGVSNLEENRLPNYRNVIFNAIALGYATNAAAGKEAELAYSTTLPVGLRNADVEIKQDGHLVVDAACSEFDADHAFTKELDRYIDLGGAYLLRELKPLEFNIEFPENTAASGGAGNDYVELRIIGFQTSESQS